MFLTLGEIRHLIRESIDDVSRAWIITPEGKLLVVKDHYDACGALAGVPAYTEMFDDDHDGAGYKSYRDKCARAYHKLHEEGMIAIRHWYDEWSVTMNDLNAESLRRLQDAIHKINIDPGERITIHSNMLSSGAANQTLKARANDVLLAQTARQLRISCTMSEGFGDNRAITGWWVLNDGGVEPVQRGEEHGDAAARIVGSDVDPDDQSDEAHSKREQAYNSLYYNGAIAIRCWTFESNTVSVTVHTLDKATWRRMQNALARVLPDLPTTRVTVNTHQPVKGTPNGVLHTRMDVLLVARDVQDAVNLTSTRPG